MNTKILGTSGEIFAKKFLEKEGYKILCSNFKNKIGEIDLIAKKKDLIVFVEVKTRTGNVYGSPAEAVTIHKQQKIRQVALSYLKQTNNLDVSCRFDVVEILNETVNHIENAF